MTYAHGTLDFGDDSTGCGPNTTGINRSERLFNFMNAFPASCSNPSPGGSCTTVDYVQIDHNAGVMMSSPAGQARLFTDNFNGNGNIAYDFGYPRAQKGDDPYPDPSKAGSLWTQATYQGNLTYQGCWTKGNTSTLAYRAYQGNTTNTIEGCTSTCLGLGYSTTGMAWGKSFPRIYKLVLIMSQVTIVTVTMLLHTTPSRLPTVHALLPAVVTQINSAVVKKFWQSGLLVTSLRSRHQLSLPLSTTILSLVV